ncbi:hypothetical protein BG004_006638 [Podila humilis]|nr:hypothetical protein BG004_006638 [Podila humilis]
MAHPLNTNQAETFAGLTTTDAQVTGLAGSHFSKPASAERINAAKAGLEKNGFIVHVVNTRADAFEALKALIPVGQTPWENIHGTIIAEKDAVKQAELRRKLGSTVDYYLTSVAAISESGQLTHGDLSGSKVEGVAFGAGKVIVVAGSNKIVKDQTEAIQRLKEHALPLESARVRIAYGLPASALTHISAINQASPFNKERVHVVLVNEALGY